MSASEPLIAIDDALRSHLESGVAIVVGTRDASLNPEITRGWGARIMPDRHTIELCLSRSSGAKTLANLRDNEQLAVTFALPTNYRTVQLKGRLLETGEPTPEDLEGVERHRSAFAKQAEIVGLPRSPQFEVVDR